MINSQEITFPPIFEITNEMHRATDLINQKKVSFLQANWVAVSSHI